jgi:hypothetical protein
MARERSVLTSAMEILGCPIKLTGKHPMTEETKPPTFTVAEFKRELVNDSLGTIDTADSTGSDETKETGDAKKGNTQTRED